ncbi:unnamed protein product [Sphagnum tenellum]
MDHSRRPAAEQPPVKEWGREIVIDLSIYHHPQRKLPARNGSARKRLNLNDSLFTCGIVLFTGTFLFYLPVRGEADLGTTLGASTPDSSAETESPYHQDWQTYLKEYEQHLEKAQESPPSEAEVANLQLLWTATLSPLKMWGTPSPPTVLLKSRPGSPLSTPAINSFKWNGPELPRATPAKRS